MDNTRRDALKSLSRAATKVEPKPAGLLSQVASSNSGDPGDLAGTGAGPATFPAKETRPVYTGTLINHSTRRLTVDVLTEPSDA
jgi:hypothetical protein